MWLKALIGIEPAVFWPQNICPHQSPEKDILRNQEKAHPTVIAYLDGCTVPVRSIRLNMTYCARFGLRVILLVGPGAPSPRSGKGNQSARTTQGVFFWAVKVQ